jgi:hypothetical protein
MAHVSSQRCMALAWMQSCGVRQMFGYIVPTWFGYGGWGVHRYLWGNVGMLTFAEAYFANQQALQLRLYQAGHWILRRQHLFLPPSLEGNDWKSTRAAIDSTSSNHSIHCRWC